MPEEGAEKDLTPAQSKRVAKALEVVEDRMLPLNEALILASAEDRKPHIIQSLLQKATATRDQLETVVVPRLKALHEKPVAGKTYFADTFEIGKTASQEAKEYAKRLKQMVEESNLEVLF